MALGFVRHSNAVHYGDGERRGAFHRHLLDGMPSGFAAEDGAALRFVGHELVEVVASRPETRAYKLERRGSQVSRRSARARAPSHPRPRRPRLRPASRKRRALRSDRGASGEVVSLFRLGENPVDLRDELLAQDVIYAGGGSMLNPIAIWRAHALDEVLWECWRAGVLIAGQSAGASSSCANPSRPERPEGERRGGARAGWASRPRTRSGGGAFVEV